MDINTEMLKENLKSENIIDFFSKFDIMTILTNPYYLIPILGVAIFLIVTKRINILVCIIAFFVLLTFLPDFLPKPQGPDGGYALGDLAKFVGLLVVVGGVVVYFFFVKKD
jgi:hypothetical protein